MDGCRQCMKYSLFAANFIILLGGIAVTAVGAVTLHDQKIFQVLVDDSLYESSSIVLIGTGCFIIFFAFMGCYGAIKEVKCFLLTYMILLLIFFVVLLIAGVLGYVFREREGQGKSGTPLKEKMRQSMNQYKHNSVVTSSWDNVQSAFKCCGVDSYKDWEGLTGGRLPEGGRVPASCCRSKDGETHCIDAPTPLNVWDVGCFTRFKEGASIVGGVGIAVACLLVLGLIFSYGVFKSIT